MVPLLGDGDMAKKARKKYKELDFDPFDEFDDLYEDLDVNELSREVQNAGINTAPLSASACSTTRLSCRLRSCRPW